MDKKQIIVNKLAELEKLYDGAPTDKSVQLLYLATLEKFSLEDVLGGLDYYIKTSVYATFPKLPHLIQAIRSFRLEGVPKPMEAWGEVIKILKKDGRRKKPEFSHPFIKEAVMRIGDWEQLCSSQSIEYDRNMFVKAFEEILDEYISN